MATFRTLLMLLGALGVLLLGATSPVMAETGPPPCHEMAGMVGMDHGTPTSTPERPMKSMACCVACIATLGVPPPLRSAVALPRARPVALDRALPNGLLTTPETGPPKG
ncbi:hypothetical protein BZG35_11115 [Brevundimonas sp. LM2]|uniref:hypothetical protein n=1 Tax=Brevundimonas sp. LM2 TaxID=1938605 RepID=UPI000983E8CF|nr:hypothetical protein [Brevundimonas sp. LM2]AQR62132.1 hypothetical protein BZG35_11115 [Brevundimonas sp. LM2]